MLFCQNNAVEYSKKYENKELSKPHKLKPHIKQQHNIIKVIARRKWYEITYHKKTSFNAYIL